VGQVVTDLLGFLSSDGAQYTPTCCDVQASTILPGRVDRLDREREVTTFADWQGRGTGKPDNWLHAATVAHVTGHVWRLPGKSRDPG